MAVGVLEGLAEKFPRIEAVVAPPRGLPLAALAALEAAGFFTGFLLVLTTKLISSFF
jgi:hypothetical protein